MLDWVEIINYESHARTRCEFTSNYHVISGTSDSGKSAILRAIRWVIYNEPSGAEFISFWAKTAKVTISIDGILITREKGAGVNTYTIKKPNEKAVCLKAFGVGPVKEILDICNMNVLNYSTQFSGHFLLNKTPGEVSKFFNNIIGISEIDTSTKKINALKNEHVSTIKVLTVEAKETEDKIKKLPDCTPIDKHVKELEAIEAELEEAEMLASNAQTLLQEYEKSKSKLVGADSLKEIKRLVKKLAANSKRVVALENNALNINTLIDNYCSSEKDARKNSELSVLKRPLKSLRLCNSNIAKFKEQLLSIELCIDSAKDSESTLNHLQREIKNDSLTLGNELDKGCPVCGK